MNERVALGRPARVRATFNDLDGEPTDPTGTAKVTAARDDGSVIFTDRDATSESDPGTVSVVFTAAELDRLDTLALTWTATVDSEDQTITTIVEVAGGFLFEMAAARDDSALSSPAAYPATKVAKARTIAEDWLESRCGFAFVPRYRRESRTARHHRWPSRRHGHAILLSAPDVRALRSVSIDDIALTTDELAAVKIERGRILAYLPRFGDSYEAAYEYGLDAPVADAGRIGLLLAKHYLVETGVSDRATELRTELGTLRLTDVPPEVAEFVEANRDDSTILS
jgi:hypothetical protein